MAGTDPWTALVVARRAYASALDDKAAAPPGTPEYQRAVHQLGVAWSRVRLWERRALRVETHEGR